jgi:hypothetical protein
MQYAVLPACGHASGGVGVSCHAGTGPGWMIWRAAVEVAEVLVGRASELALVSAFV